MIYTEDGGLTYKSDRTDRKEMLDAVDQRTLRFVAMALANAIISRGEMLGYSGSLDTLERVAPRIYARIMDDALIACDAIQTAIDERWIPAPTGMRENGPR